MGLQQPSLPWLVADGSAHRVVQISQLLEYSTEDAPQRVGEAVGGLRVDFVGKLLGRPPDRADSTGRRNTEAKGLR